MSPRLAICVVNYQGRDVLPATLAAIREQSPPAVEILLLDNASTDGSAAYVREHFPEIRIIELTVNRGPGPARESGMRAVQTDLVGFVDNDVAPDPDCFRLLAEALGQCEGAALAMPRVVYADQPGTVQFEGARAHFIGLMAIEGAERPVADPAPAPRPISSIITACFLVDRRRWGGSRLQDPSFFLYHEDHDLGLRAGQLGHRILSVPQAVCRHGKGTPGLSLRASDGYSSRRVVLMITNRWRILLTRYELRTLLLLAPALLAFELTQLVGSIAKGWFSSWVAAVASIARDLPAILHERHAWASQRRFGDGRILEGGDLPFNPRLMRSRLEHVAGKVVSAVGSLNWLLVRRLLRDSALGSRP